jgi:hypothetical protein
MLGSETFDGLRYTATAERAGVRIVVKLARKPFTVLYDAIHPYPADASAVTRPRWARSYRGKVWLNGEATTALAAARLVRTTGAAVLAL